MRAAACAGLDKSRGETGLFVGKHFITERPRPSSTENAASLPSWSLKRPTVYKPQTLCCRS